MAYKDLFYVTLPEMAFECGNFDYKNHNAICWKYLGPDGIYHSIGLNRIVNLSELISYLLENDKYKLKAIFKEMKKYDNTSYLRSILKNMDSGQELLYELGLED